MPKRSIQARRKYSLSFKRKVYEEAYESPGKVRGVARKYDVTPSTIREWKNTLHRLDVIPEKVRPGSSSFRVREIQTQPIDSEEFDALKEFYNMN